jgi:hypothetical protein
MDRLKLIFLKQLELTSQFRAIEHNNGLIDYNNSIPFLIKQPLAQKQLRATAWYIVEEIGEAMIDRTDEEVVDVLHFVVELLLCSGVGPDDIVPKSYGNVDMLDHVYSVAITNVTDNPTMELVKQLADAMHCLKAKPWKTAPKETPILVYKAKLVTTFYAFITFAIAHGLTAEKLYERYMGKAHVNQERIDAHE